MEQVRFLTQNFGRYDTSSIGSYMNIGGFSALRKAVTMDGEDIASLIAENQVKGRGGADIQRPRAHQERSFQPHRGHDHRGLRHGRDGWIHLHAR